MRTISILLLASLLLAGCSGGPSKTSKDDVVPPSVQGVEVTATTGAIRGIVIDETITPIAAADITLNGLDVTTATAEDGGFVLNDLEPGSYFVAASKPGFSTVQAAATVEAGVEPPLLRIVLPRLAGNESYANTQQWSGFTQCAFSATVVFMQACGLVDGRYINSFSIDSIPTFMQAEMHWQSTQAVTPKLQLNFYQSGTTDWKAAAGVSPLLLTATGEEFVEAKGEDATDNPMRVSPPYLQCAGGVTDPASCDPQTFAIVNVNQAYDVYLTQFYGFTPRDGWLLAVDGACSSPEQCGGVRSDAAAAP